MVASSTANGQWCTEIVLNFTHSASGTTVQFTDQSSSSNGWAIEKRYWDYGDSIVDSIILNPVHTYAEPGIYNVCVTVHGVLPGDSATELHCMATKCNQVQALGTGISNLDDNEWQIYPNPSYGRLKLKGNTDKIQSLSLCNSIGQVVYTYHAINGWVELPSDLNPDLYFVKIRMENGKEKLIRHLAL